MINHLTLSPLTVLVRTNREDSVNYLRINADLSRPETVATAAADAFYQDIRDNLDLSECDPGSAGDAWRENDCGIVGIAEGHFNITTSGCDTVSSLCSYLQFAIDAEKPPRVEEPRSVAAVHAFAHAYGGTAEETLISVFVGNDDSEPDYDTFLSVVAASHDTEAVIAAVKADYEASRGAGHWNEDGAFIVGAGEGSFRGAWNPDGLAVADIAAVCAGVLGGAK